VAAAGCVASPKLKIIKPAALAIRCPPGGGRACGGGGGVRACERSGECSVVASSVSVPHHPSPLSSPLL
jgi:hypothetical protein